ncbi:uncharacterized protein BJ171DRAFT_157120 [Polychytrium aggregatum]|uniref:uncharacterized protein n=1 Tax=Polychytrium aggregatum TaxID=110093 RepID=UPI0022FE90D7|nr:uncharacterized protein BJ171DRAFT_157120 [Polychytrium aggregatum]KAI9202951.1 hypothetical protein BJ171DRAFT_157120 [Polychytrium aggregatum]
MDLQKQSHIWKQRLTHDDQQLTQMTAELSTCIGEQRRHEETERTLHEELSQMRQLHSNTQQQLQGQMDKLKAQHAEQVAALMDDIRTLEAREARWSMLYKRDAFSARDHRSDSGRAVDHGSPSPLKQDHDRSPQGRLYGHRMSPSKPPTPPKPGAALAATATPLSDRAVHSTPFPSRAAISPITKETRYSPHQPMAVDSAHARSTTSETPTFLFDEAKNAAKVVEDFSRKISELERNFDRIEFGL